MFKKSHHYGIKEYCTRLAIRTIGTLLDILSNILFFKWFYTAFGQKK